jgi:hypothetical protein
MHAADTSVGCAVLLLILPKVALLMLILPLVG